MKIGLTGNIASGKSTVMQFFKDHGLATLDADIIVHQLYQQAWLIEKIRQAFGASVLDDQGQINRSTLGEIVFSQASALQKLNQITQQPIRQELETQVLHFEEQFGVVALEATLIVERNWTAFFDTTLAITCPDELRLQRLMQRNQLDQNTAQKRLDSQMDQFQKASACDHQISNHSDEAQLYHTWRKWAEGLKII